MAEGEEAVASMHAELEVRDAHIHSIQVTDRERPCRAYWPPCDFHIRCKHAAVR